MSDDFDLEGIGFTLDDLDLCGLVDDLAPLPLDRPRYRPKGWWTTTEAEAHFLDLPDFEDGAQRTRFMIAQMARASGADDDEPVIPYMGRMVSLNELLATIGNKAIERLDEHR